MATHPTGDQPDHSAGGLAEDLESVARGRPFQWGLLVGGVVAVAAALLVVQNARSTAFEWLWLEFDAPLWLLLAATLAAGMVVAEAARLLWQRSRARAAERRSVVTAAGRRLRRRR